MSSVSASSSSSRRGLPVGAWAGLFAQTAILAALTRSEDDGWSALLAIASFLVVVATGRLTLRLDPLSPSMIYFYVLGVFHLGLVGPWALGMGPDQVPYWVLQLRMTPALTLVVVAFTSYQLGLSLGLLRRPAPGASAAPRPTAYHNRVMYQIGMVVIGVGFLSLVWGAYVIGFDRMANATYFDVYRLASTFDPRFFATSLQVAPIGLYLAVAAAPRDRLPFVSALGGLWIAMIFILGFRGFALVPLATVVAVLAKRGIRPPRWAYVAGGLALLFLIPAARGLRDESLAERSIEDILLPKHPLSAIAEMGGSLRPLVHTIDLMENEDLRWGSTYWGAVSMIVPNLSIEWEGDRYLPVEEMPPSHWVTRLAAPWHYAHHGGLGFSAVAEPYMNFGPAGVVLVFIGLGAALIWVDRWSAARPLPLAMWAMALGPLLWTTRNTAGVFFRPTVWGLAVAVGAWWLSVWLARLRRVRATKATVRRKVLDVHAYN